MVLVLGVVVVGLVCYGRGLELEFYCSVVMLFRVWRFLLVDAV